ncbi:MAG TPA: hypothetical protein VMT32_02005 [Bryobacteraceae bacterium]|nr:hypothetical protein [Bryobacteraceae bacterium]
MPRRLSWTARIALALVLTSAAWFAAWLVWDSTRTWQPVDTPVSLSPGHFRTEFWINVEANYSIGIAIDRNYDYVRLPCLVGVEQCENSPSLLSASWSVSQAGCVVAHGLSETEHESFWPEFESIGRVIGTFHANGGRYILDLDFLQDGSRLNTRGPYLVVYASEFERQKSQDHGAKAFLFLLLSAVAGVYLLIRSAIMRRRKENAGWARAHSFTQPGPQPRNLQIGPPPLAATSFLTGFRLRAPAWLGAFLLVAGFAAYAAIHHWMTTRTFVAADLPVSLSPGHIRTGPFSINLSESYSIWLNTDRERLDADYSKSALLDTRWALYKSGRVVARSHEPFISGTQLEDFKGQPGIYNLDVEVLKDASCLNADHPRLRVFTDPSGYASLVERLLCLCLISMGAGASLLVVAGRAHVGRLPPVAPDAEWAMVRGHLPLKVRLPRPGPFSGMPAWGLFAANTFLIVLLPVWLIQSWLGVLRILVGLPIHLQRPALSSPPSPGIQPLLVHLEAAPNYARPTLYVNSQAVAWEDLTAVLQRELPLRPPNWPVYVEGRGEMEWGHTVRVIDAIRGLRAEVVLLTHSNSVTPTGRR